MLQNTRSSKVSGFCYVPNLSYKKQAEDHDSATIEPLFLTYSFEV